ncbi:insulinase family protein [Shewanella sp. 202IG2-18]|uniref:M16 family metallopeptidase n=1 Tax=Parashewanella hymeniacidonis TaxID=2807618 RepID=UPI0019610FB5|nr:pitrilysin family protein [Parashewanella hymeniacidonis]MBM7073986.1 insulinase family protein [Parashewanella hymeniacidonis]
MKWNWMLVGSALVIKPVLADSCNLTAQAMPLYQLEQSIAHKVLDNGLNVRLINRPSKKTVSVVSQFNVGSKNEVEGQTGYAHLFEHLMFEGSKHAPGDSFSQQMDAVGADTNATTWFDRTNYFETIPTFALELAFFLDSDRLRFPDLTKKTIAIQKQAVLQERTLMLESQPYLEPASEFLFQQIRDTPYGHSVIGSRKDIQSATQAELQAFHQKYYRPDNMQLSIVGALPDNIDELVTEYFAHWPKPDSESTPQPEVNIQPRAISGEIVDDRGPWPASLLFWQTVGRSHPDKAAIQLLQAHLFSDKSAELQLNNLHDPEYMLYYPLAQSLSEIGVAGLAIAPRARTQLDAQVKSITSLIHQVQKNSIDEQRLCYLKSVYLNGRINLLQDNLTIAKVLSDTQSSQSQNPLTASWQQVNQVSVADIRRVANIYFSPAHSIRLDLLPPWYIRWAKSVLELLPKRTTDSLEEDAL